MSELAVQYNGVYKRRSDLPPAVRHALHHLPHALDTWRKAYDAAAKSGNYKSKSAAYQIAWAAVQHRYEKNKQGKWVERKNWKPAKDSLAAMDSGAFRLVDMDDVGRALALLAQSAMPEAHQDVYAHVSERAYAIAQGHS